MKPRLLDLFCGAGGCSVGYARAGFEVVGVDLVDQPNYPFEFVQDDALYFVDAWLRGWDYHRAWFRDFDAIHASPPCQAYSNTYRIQKTDHPDLVSETRRLLDATGLPYIIENVKGAPLNDPVVLEGQMFGLNTHRPRLFETNWPLDVPLLRLSPPRQVKMGRPLKPGEAIQVVGHFSDMKAGQEAMGIDWMNRDELSEAIPPAYTELIGHQLMQHLAAQTEEQR